MHKIKTLPIPEIVPELNSELEKILLRFSNLICELVNYGSHIIAWDLEIKREGKDNNIPTLFLRNIIELCDTQSILIRNSSIDPAKNLFRTLLENCFSLIYMIEENEKQRALSFMVVKTYEQINEYKKWISEEQLSVTNLKELNKDSIDYSYGKLVDNPEIIKTMNLKKSLLEKPEFKNTVIEYQRTKKKKGFYKGNWYSLYDGPSNFLELAKHLKKYAYYDFIYRKYSNNVHGTEVMKGMVASDSNNAQIIQIRDFENAQDLIVRILTLTLETYLIFINQRVPKKIVEFSNWYGDYKKQFEELLKSKIITVNK